MNPDSVVTLSAAKGPERSFGRFAALSVTSPLRVAFFLLAACNGKDDGTFRLSANQPETVENPADQPPVAINPLSPVEYPGALLDQGIEGRVLLRLYVDAQGRLIEDSTRVVESSGYPAFDSAAVAGAAALRFSPALRYGRAVSAPFLQPVHFRNPRTRSRSP